MADGSGVGLVGFGVELPSEVRLNAFFSGIEANLRGERDLLALAERVVDGSTAIGRSVERQRGDPFRGTRERRVAAPGARSSDLELAACSAALGSAGLGAADVDLLVGYSQVPDDPTPANHGRLARRLGAGHHLAAMTLEAGCASFVTQLSTAVRLVAAGDARAALLYQSSLGSRIFDPDDPTAPLFGDGAAAEVVGKVPAGLGFVGWSQHTWGELCDGLVLGHEDGSDWLAPSATPLRARSRDRDAAARMGADAPQFAREVCGPLLERFGVRPDQVDFFAVAQASAWFGPVCAEAVGVPVERTVPAAEHFERFGHLLPASLPLNLWVAWQGGRLRPGDLVLAYSPGAGFTAAAALLRWSLPPP